jgi:hypothetical protein
MRPQAYRAEPDAGAIVKEARMLYSKIRLHQMDKPKWSAVKNTLYNNEDRKLVPIARTLAVVSLRTSGFSYKTIAYAMNIGPDQARAIYSREMWKRAKAERLRSVLAEKLVSADIIKKHFKTLTIGGFR